MISIPQKNNQVIRSRIETLSMQFIKFKAKPSPRKRIR